MSPKLPSSSEYPLPLNLLNKFLFFLCSVSEYLQCWLILKWKICLIMFLVPEKIPYCSISLLPTNPVDYNIFIWHYQKARLIFPQIKQVLAITNIFIYIFKNILYCIFIYIIFHAKIIKPFKVCPTTGCFILTPILVKLISKRVHNK